MIVFGWEQSPVYTPANEIFDDPYPSYRITQGGVGLAGITVNFVINNAVDSDLGILTNFHFTSGGVTYTGVTGADGRVVFDAASGTPGAGHGPTIIADLGGFDLAQNATSITATIPSIAGSTSSAYIVHVVTP